VSGIADFVGFPKIRRWANTGMTITEKIDGTNACILITEDDRFVCQSRSRIITPEDDNAGFARWAYENREELTRFLGFGRHFGEWWGAGIQRRYDRAHKIFTPFNVHRFNLDTEGWPSQTLPLPVLYKGPVSASAVEYAQDYLREHGSQAAPGFMNPEGVMVYVDHLGYLKAPFDPAPKAVAAVEKPEDFALAHIDPYGDTA
jgi:hypothetical protein